MLNSGPRPGAMPGFVNNPHYMFNQRYSEKKSANKINGIASYGIYGNVSKSMTGFGSPFNFSNLFPTEVATRGAGGPPQTILDALIAQAKIDASKNARVEKSVGPQAFMSLDIESLMEEISVFSEDKASGKHIMLGRVPLEGKAPRPIGVAMTDPSGKSMGYTFLDTYEAFDINEFIRRGSLGVAQPIPFRREILSEHNLRSLAASAGLAADSSREDILKAILGVDFGGPTGLTAQITDEQFEYLSKTVGKNYHSYLTNTIIEGMSTEGAKPEKAHKAIITNVIEMLEEASTKTNKLIGFNIVGFDLKRLERLAYSEGLGDRFGAAVNRFEIVDVMLEYEKIITAINVPSELSSKPLDVVARAYGRYDNVLKDMIEKRGVHAAGRDAHITARVYELMQQGNIQLTIDDHLNAIIDAAEYNRLSATATTELFDDVIGKTISNKNLEVAAGKAKIHLASIASGGSPPRPPVPPSPPGGEALPPKPPGSATIEMMNDISSKVHPKLIAGGLMVGALVLFMDAITEDDQTPLDKLNDIGRYLTQRRADRKEWISASALQLEGNDRFYRLIDPTLEEKYSVKSDYEKRKTSQVQEMGNVTHERVQELLEAQGLGQREYYVEDTRNKVFGYVDFMLKGGIPLEIKTTDYNKWEGMSAPKEEHVRQANFDTMATDSPYAYIMYVPRGMPEKQKTFAVYRDPSRYSQDVTAAREIQRQYGDQIQSSEPELSGFRPLSSIFNNTMNDRVVNADIGYNRSKIRDQKTRLANLGASSSYNRLGNARHYNESSRASGGYAYG